MSAVLLFAKTFWKPLAGALVLLLALWALHHYGNTRFQAGAQAVNDKWVAANQKAEVAARQKEDADRQAIAQKTGPIKEARDEELQKTINVRADVVRGTRIVRVSAVCPRSDLPQGAAPAAVDDGKTAQLDPAAGAVVLDLKAQLLKTEAALAGLQEWAAIVAK